MKTELFLQQPTNIKRNCLISFVSSRFASFVEGNSHLSDEEILCYESSIHETELTDDEENSFSEED